MPIIPHAERPAIVVPRITTRRIVTTADGAQTLEMWEQYMPTGGHIPPHYHECDEIITILSGRLQFTLGAVTQTIVAEPNSPISIFIPPRIVHHAANEGDREVHLLAVFSETEPRVFLPDGELVKLPWQGP